MKKYFLLLLIPVFFACGRQAKQQAEELQAQKDSLLIQAMQKDEAINEFIASINDIQGTLDTIKMKENIISLSTDRGNELRVSAKEQIKSDIQSIYTLLLKNKNSLKELNARLKKSDMKVDELQKLVDRLTQDIVLKSQEIETLREKLAKMNITIEQANLRMEELSQTVQSQSEQLENQTQTIEEQQNALNTGYYIIGSAKELKKNGIIKGDNILPDFNKSLFTRIDIAKTNEIPILSKKAKVLSTHPASSYKLTTGDQKLIQAVQITDPATFWGATKYLVIVID